MIEFEEGANNIRSQLYDIQTHARLLQALANFHIDSDTLHNSEDIENQRDQLVREIKRLQTMLGRLQNAIQTAGPTAETDARQMGLLDRFIAEAIPGEARDIWNPDDFTGSLHVFMIDGAIDSCSLIPKRDLHRIPVFDEEEAEAAEREDVRVIQADERTFSVLKTPSDENVNIYFSLSEAAFVIIKIYDENDRLVRHIENLYNDPGDYSVRWDGGDNDGNKLPRGNYYCQLQIGENLTEVKSFSLS